jgi:hypothetical protein
MSTTHINAAKTATRNDELISGNFQVKSMIMTNANGAEMSIVQYVTSFNITAEIFSPVLTLSATIRDNDDIFGSGVIGKLTGQEIIKLKIIGDYDKENVIEHTFSVKEYSNYTKTLDYPNTQIFNLIAISDFAYTSKLKTICRSVSNIEASLREIFVTDLELADLIIDTESPVSNFTGIINIQTPLSAAEWLRSRSFDSVRSPFFLYNKVSSTSRNVVYFGSFNSLARKSVGERYKYEYGQSLDDSKPNKEKYEKDVKRILSMRSNLKMDRLATAAAGGYANRINVTDIASKSYYTLNLTTTESANKWTSREYLVGRGPNGNTPQKMHDISHASISNIQINNAGGSSFNDPKNSVTESLLPNIQIAKSFAARVNEFDHEIVVYGNPGLNPGTVINLKVPKTLRERKAKSGEIDPVVSGNYLITVAAHIFTDGVYTCRLKLFGVNDLPIIKTSEPVPNLDPSLAIPAEGETPPADTTPAVDINSDVPQNAAEFIPPNLSPIIPNGGPTFNGDPGVLPNVGEL